MLIPLLDTDIFDGQQWIAASNITVTDGIINFEELANYTGLTYLPTRRYMLVPAFVDLQVYGRGSFLFSQYPHAEALATLASENRQHGTVACLVTIATQTFENIISCLQAINDYWKLGGKGILGLHLEGPFINKDKRGAHKDEWIVKPTVDMVSTILAHSHGALKMVTLAPELCSEEIIASFILAGVIVSAGHTNASFGEAMQWPKMGINLVTHLFNAMTPFHHREPGVAGAVFTHDNLYATIIPDGMHVHFDVLKAAKKVMGNRLMYITDAVTACDEGVYTHQLQDGYYALPNGVLSGSALHMDDAVWHGHLHAKIPLAESLRMASLYPAQVLQLQKLYGTIKRNIVSASVLINRNTKEVESVFGF